MDNWREKFYQKYVASHISSERSEMSLKDIERQFFVWNKRYGKLLPASKESLILEIGCGAGELVYWLNKMGYNTLTSQSPIIPVLLGTEKTAIKPVEDKKK